MEKHLSRKSRRVMPQNNKTGSQVKRECRRGAFKVVLYDTPHPLNTSAGDQMCGRVGEKIEKQHLGPKPSPASSSFSFQCLANMQDRWLRIQGLPSCYSCYCNCPAISHVMVHTRRRITYIYNIRNCRMMYLAAHESEQSLPEILPKVSVSVWNEDLGFYNRQSQNEIRRTV